MKTLTPLLALGAALAALSCGTQQKLQSISSGLTRPELSLPASRSGSIRSAEIPDSPHDTLLVVDFEGRETLIMNAIRDEDGEMVATDRLSAAVVSARFRNVAERHGRVDLEFQVTVPRSMQDSRWQLRLDPDMFVLGDSLRLDPVLITGRDYRKAQLRGYQQYRRFLESIITDSTRFVKLHELEIFIRRNLPQVYAFRSDSTFVSDEEFASAYGVTERQAVDHYTWKLFKRHNQWKMKRKDLMFRRYVKAPIVSEGIRLDTVMRSDNGDFVYNYVQTINTRPSLRKVDIVLSGGIWEQDKRIYDIPRSEPLTFYISSVSTLADWSERYVSKVVGRRVEANTACYIEFPQGKAVIAPSLGHNAEEMGRIKDNIRGLLVSETFELDSIAIVAFASPEGARASNELLSSKRAAAASAYFENFIQQVQDSLSAEAGVMLEINGSKTQEMNKNAITFSSRSGGENWSMLDALVSKDSALDAAAQDAYQRCSELAADPDRREKLLSREPCYRYLREHLYPRLRVVRFDFFLHRKGMVQDTLRTTEVDTVYMNGLQCIRDRDYEGALARLRPYSDFNTALVYLALDRNSSAKEILLREQKSARVDYLLAILYSREADDRKAVEHYLHACAQEPSFVHRGNLDPEISALIRKYDLRPEENESF